MNQALRSVAIPSGEVAVRERFFKESRRRAEGFYFGVFVGQHQTGPWHPTREKAEALADDIRKARRPCLCCGHQFQSQGSHNRMCDDCRRRTGGLI